MTTYYIKPLRSPALVALPTNSKLTMLYIPSDHSVYRHDEMLLDGVMQLVVVVVPYNQRVDNAKIFTYPRVAPFIMPEVVVCDYNLSRTQFRNAYEFFRLENGFQNKDVASRLGCSPECVSMATSKARAGRPSPSTIRKYANALKVPIENFLTYAKQREM